jgi:transcriptional regulator GlxA family with amidase domain
VSNKTVAFVLYPGLTPLDLIGPLQVMSGLEAVEEALGSPDRHRVVVVAERLDAFPTDTPARIAASNTLDDVPAPDVILVVCTGSLLLAGAGLLQGRPATTHWAYRGFLDRLGARYVAERWVEDGRYLTGAGVSAGIDTALRLASRLASDEMSRLVQLAIEYDPRPPLGGIDWSTVDRDMLRPRVEGFAKEALGDNPGLLARLLG